MPKHTYTLKFCSWGDNTTCVIDDMGEKTLWGTEMFPQLCPHFPNNRKLPHNMLPGWGRAQMHTWKDKADAIRPLQLGKQSTKTDMQSCIT